MRGNGACPQLLEEGLMKKILIVVSVALAILSVGIANRSSWIHAQESASQSSRLAVIWTSGDPEVAHRVCFMYTDNAKKQKWFDEVTLIVWGPSARLLAGDKDLQAKIKVMLEDGVKVQACQACADSYGVTEQLRKMGIDVKYMGKPLTDLIKQGWHTLTF
jgi:hypothetical protein